MEQGFTPHSTQNSSFRRRSSQPISLFGTKKAKPNKTNNTKPKKYIKIQTKPLPRKHTKILQAELHHHCDKPVVNHRSHSVG